MIGKIVTALIAGLAAVSAYTPPVGEPSGNPIAKPGLQESVPAGQPYTITWNPTTPGTVSILLLRGPSENVVPIATLVEGAPNSGSYVWTPSTDLDDDVTHYGLQLIVDGTGQYQWSTQFGISNPSKGKGSSSSSSSSVAPPSSSSYSAAPSSYGHGKNATTTITSCTSSSSSYAPVGSGYPPKQNGTVVAPTYPPSTLVPTAPTATQTKPPVQTANSGVKVLASYGGAAVALFAAVAAL